MLRSPSPRAKIRPEQITNFSPMYNYSLGRPEFKSSPQ
jgi:hypothetical protein